MNNCTQTGRSGKRFLGMYPIEDIDRIYAGFNKEEGAPFIAVRTLLGTVERHPMCITDAVKELRELGCTVTRRLLTDFTYDVSVAEAA